MVLRSENVSNSSAKFSRKYNQETRKLEVLSFFINLGTPLYDYFFYTKFPLHRRDKLVNGSRSTETALELLKPSRGVRIFVATKISRLTCQQANDRIFPCKKQRESARNDAPKKKKPRFRSALHGGTRIRNFPIRSKGRERGSLPLRFLHNSLGNSPGFIGQIVILLVRSRKIKHLFCR